jgi:putative transposase
MSKARFTGEQIFRISQEADRDAIKAVATRHGVSEASIYVLRKRFGDMGTDDVKRLLNLEQENCRQNKILAERDLEIEVMKEITAKKVVSMQSRLNQTRYAIERGISQRQAFALLQVARSGLTYTCKMPIKDATIFQVMRHYSGKYPRFGARRVRVFYGVMA